jgi:prevent-host-death family protein
VKSRQTRQLVDRLVDVTTWQVQTAKQRFSEVLRAAESGEPQFITKHGETVAVLVDIADYRASHVARRSLADFLLSGSTAVGLEEELELPPRAGDPDRAATLFRER